MKNRIKDMREDHDLEQKDLAEILKISRQYYSRYELGQIDLPIRHYIALARFYNVSIDYLCGLTDLPKPLFEQDKLSPALSKYNRLIQQYRANPSLQPAVNKLLDLNEK